MIKQLALAFPYVMKLERREFETGRKFKRNGLFGGEFVETKTEYVPVPDYPETNKRLVHTLSKIISDHALDLGEIHRAQITPSPSGDEYLISLEGAYANYKKIVPVEKGFGENGEEQTPLYCLMEEMKMIWEENAKKMEESPYYEASKAISFTRELLERYIKKLKDYELGT